MSTPARSRCVAVVCLLFEAQNSRHNTETSITLRSIDGEEFIDGFSGSWTTNAQYYRHAGPVATGALAFFHAHRLLRNSRSRSGARYRPGRVLKGAVRDSAFSFRAMSASK